MMHYDQNSNYWWLLSWKTEITRQYILSQSIESNGLSHSVSKITVVCSKRMHITETQMFLWVD